MRWNSFMFNHLRHTGPGKPAMVQKPKMGDVDPATGYQIPAGVSPADNDTAYSYSSVKGMLQYVGVPPLVAPWSTGQTALETNDWKSHVSQADKNLSGITWINNPKLQKNATRGTAKPKSDGGGYYAKFNTYNDWAADYKRIISKGGAHAPIEAKTLPDFVHRLKLNKYFQSSESDYLNGIIAKIKKFEPLQQLHEQQLAQGITNWHEEHDNDPFPGQADFFAWIKAHPLQAGGLALITAFGISALFRGR